ncbi:MAG TPA: DUF1080 domain-containing protein [Verrucomicrobiota bacterium]|nr:DUF1080 domain-containing protein [Verrucomicrobiota bacterium]HRT08288.1 DUF1080 domain-containing protein [Candidatus Paceibacterota bacterium]HRT56692.1 DUF1080 domain-containing protein [Candidatus Paceibacterota bacterium]
MKTTLRFASALLLSSVAAIAADNGWVNLFNGKDLSGWVQRGGKAKYTVQEGILVGSTVLDTPNSFLCTEKTYGDFILELEFKVDPLLNSGVQVRSECFDTEKKVQANGKEIRIPAGRVHGYQVEIDMDAAKNRWWSGGIYDEGRRAWLYPGILGGDSKAFTEQGAKVSKPGEWNHYRIEARGASIKTWLNGQLRATINDNMTPRGFIALQVHSVGKDASKENLKVQFRNIRLKELPGN